MSRPLGRLPPLNALRAFVAAARHLSFSRAAEELFVTPAAVSQQVKLLEDNLGRVLFRRTNRALLLTDEGQALLPRLFEAFELMSEALGSLDTMADTGALTVSMAPSFAGKWLVPRLASWSRRHPDITVRLRGLALSSGREHPQLSLVLQTFKDLAATLLVHLEKEEHILFPYVRELARAADTGLPLPPGPFGTVANPVRMMEDEHQAAMHDLARLQALTHHYAIPTAPVPGLAEAWAALREFDVDLREHIRLEDQELFPGALDLEVRLT